MKKKFVFTDDSSFTHVKNKMHHGVTEHILQEDTTKKLYHYVVSYGAPFKISDSAIFMSQLLKEIGVTGFCTSYSANNCRILLPWYPSTKIDRQAIVELPQNVKLENIVFGKSELPMSDRFKQTFLEKKYKIKLEDGKVCDYTGKELLKIMFGCWAFNPVDFCEGDTAYPFYIILDKIPLDKYYKKEFVNLLYSLDINEHAEIYSILNKFAKIDIKKAVKSFEKEIGKQTPEMCTELLFRQAVVQGHLWSKKQTNNIQKDKDM